MEAYSVHACVPNADTERVSRFTQAIHGCDTCSGRMTGVCISSIARRRHPRVSCVRPSIIFMNCMETELHPAAISVHMEQHRGPSNQRASGTRCCAWRQPVKRGTRGEKHFAALRGAQDVISCDKRREWSRGDTNEFRLRIEPVYRVGGGRA